MMMNKLNIIDMCGVYVMVVNVNEFYKVRVVRVGEEDIMFLEL